MLIKTTTHSSCKEYQVTDEKVYFERRDMLKKMGFFGAGALPSSTAGASVFDIFSDDQPATIFKQNNLKYSHLRDYI